MSATWSRVPMNFGRTGHRFGPYFVCAVYPPSFGATSPTHWAVKLGGELVATGKTLREAKLAAEAAHKAAFTVGAML